MDKHYSVGCKVADGEYLITNRADDVIGTIKMRPYDKKETFPVLNSIISGLSDTELKDIISNFVRVAEKTAEYDKCGQSYYIAKNWLREHKM